VKWGGYSIAPTTLASFFDDAASAGQNSSLPASFQASEGTAMPSHTWSSISTQNFLDKSFHSSYQQPIFPAMPSVASLATHKPHIPDPERTQKPKTSPSRGRTTAKRVSDRAEAPHTDSDGDDPEPRPPSEDQKKSLRGTGKCNYTGIAQYGSSNSSPINLLLSDPEIKFIRDYISWTARRGRGDITIGQLATDISDKVVRRIDPRIETDLGLVRCHGMVLEV
jgi:hypothetical protein